MAVVFGGVTLVLGLWRNWTSVIRRPDLTPGEKFSKLLGIKQPELEQFAWMALSATIAGQVVLLVPAGSVVKAFAGLIVFLTAAVGSALLLGLIADLLDKPKNMARLMVVLCLVGSCWTMFSWPRADWSVWLVTGVVLFCLLPATISLSRQDK